MKHFLAFAALSLFAAVAYGQPGGPQVKYVSSAPSGACSAGALPVQVNLHDIWVCDTSTHLWTKSGGGGGTQYLAPSGDVTGVTDRAAIQAALTAGSTVQLGRGTYYIDNTGLVLPSGGGVLGISPNGTVIQMEGSTGYVFSVTYQRSINGIKAASLLSNFTCQQDSGVTPSAGGCIYVGTGLAGTDVTSGLRVSNLGIIGVYHGIYIDQGVWRNWFQNLIISDPVADCIHYNSGPPSGDQWIEDVGCNYTTGRIGGLTIDQSDTTMFNHLKLSNTNVLFTGTGAGGITRSVRFQNSSVEDYSGSCGVQKSSSFPGPATIGGITWDNGEFGFGPTSMACDAVGSTGAGWITFTNVVDGTADNVNVVNALFNTPVTSSPEAFSTMNGSYVNDAYYQSLRIKARGSTTQYPIVGGSVADNEAFFGFFGFPTATNTYYAANVAPSFMEVVNGRLSVYADSGKTPGAAYTPTKVWSTGITQTGAATAEIDFTTCFSSSFEDYDISWAITLLGTGSLGFQMNTGSGYDTGSNYAQSRGFFNPISSATLQGSGTTGANFDLGGSSGYGSNTAGYYTGTIRLRSVNSTTNYKSIDGFMEDGATGAVPVGLTTFGSYKSTSALTAFRLVSNATFTGSVTCTPVAK